MIEIDDLTGISENKRKQAIECLDDLLTFKDSEGELSPIITRYNWYTVLSKSDSIVTFSNIHETEDYKRDMIRDLKILGYDDTTILMNIREKAAIFLWEIYFNIRDDKNKILPGLKVKDSMTKQYFDLVPFEKPLEEYKQFSEAKWYLIAENHGWELDMAFNNKKELLDLVNLFLRKSGRFVYDEEGNIIVETEEERTTRSPWTDAYETPVLLFGETALKYLDELPHFIQATKIVLKENSNEISFVIHRNLDQLRDLPHYEQLLKLGFKEEACLGNKPFIAEYIDKKR